MLHLPHTSHILQLEDVANFREFKQLLRVTVAGILTAKALSQLRDWDAMPTATLGNEDLMDCVREPWMAAFRWAKCMTGWAMTGLYPYMQCVFWDVRKQEQARDQTRERTEKKTGLQWNLFTMQGPVRKPDKRHLLVGGGGLQVGRRARTLTTRRRLGRA